VLKINYIYRNTSIFLFLLVLSCIEINAQDQKSQFWSHVRIGGGIGLSFGDGFFSGTLAPSAVYDFNDKFSMGVGLNGTYNKEKNFYESTIIGGSVLGLYNVIPQLQISTEFEQLHVSRSYDNSLFLNDTYWQPALFLGAGFRQNNFTIGLRYDVLYDTAKSVYASAYVPFVRVYF
jgi:hypothetical protein